MLEVSTCLNPGGVGKLHDVGIEPTALVKGMVDRTTMAPKPYSSPSKYLQVEFSKDNRKIVEFKRDVLAGKNINAKRHIIEDTSGKHATTKIARRKLDAIGNIKSHGGLVNDPESIIKLENRSGDRFSTRLIKE